MLGIIRRTVLSAIAVWSAMLSLALGQTSPLAVFTGTVDPAPLAIADFRPAGLWNSDSVVDFVAIRQRENIGYPPILYEGIEVIDGSSLGSLYYFPLSAVSSRRLVSAGDWNGDGRHELLIDEYLSLRVQDPVSGQVFANFNMPMTSWGPGLFGIEECCFAEVTGDLIPDLCALAWDGSFDRRLVILSGVDGSLIRFEPLLSDHYRSIRSLPDRNNDGRNELGVLCSCTVPTWYDRLRVLDGATLSVLVDGPPLSSFPVSLPTYIMSEFNLDLTGDGVPDFAFLHGDNSWFTLSLVSGATGTEVWAVPTIPFPLWDVPFHPVDAACVVTDDIDNDGRRDILVSSADMIGTSGFPVPPYSQVHSSATGQTIRATTHPLGTGLSASAHSIGDHDGDGKVDTICAKPQEVAIHSSRTGETITRRLRRVGSDRLGSFTYLADWNRDGISDLFVSTPGSAEGGSIDVYSGVDRGLLATIHAPEPSFSFGSSVLQIPDQDADGIADYAVSAPADHVDGLYEAGRVYFLSGTTGQVVWKMEGTESKANFGHALLLLPDIDGDGSADLAVSAPSQIIPIGYFSSAPLGCSTLYFVSSGTRQIIRSVCLPGNIAGKELRLSGDLDMDGLADIFALIDYAPHMVWPCIMGSGLWPPLPCSWTPIFEIISTGTGISLRNSSVVAMWSDSSTAGFVDLDADGYDEVITFSACGPISCGVGISCHSTFDGLLRWTLPVHPSPAEHQQVMGFPDFSNDGRPDWAVVGDSGATTMFVGSPPSLHSIRPANLPRIAKRHQKTWTDQDNDGIPEIVVPSLGPAPSEQVGPGEVRILSGADYSPASSIFGSGSPGGGGLEPKLRVLGHPPAVGEATFAIGLSHAAANAAVVLGISSALDSSPTSLLGASFYLDFTASSLLLDSVFRVPMPTAVNPTGVLRIPLPIPNSAAWHGLTLHFQAAVVDPNAANGIFSTTPVLSVSIP